MHAIFPSLCVGITQVAMVSMRIEHRLKIMTKTITITTALTQPQKSKANSFTHNAHREMDMDIELFSATNCICWAFLFYRFPSEGKSVFDMKWTKRKSENEWVMIHIRIGNPFMLYHAIIIYIERRSTASNGITLGWNPKWKSINRVILHVSLNLNWTNKTSGKLVLDLFRT